MRRSSTMFYLLLALPVVLVGCGAKANRSDLQVAVKSADSLQAANGRAFPGQTPGISKPGSPADNARIAKITAEILDQSDYVKLPNHEEVSSRLLDHYLDGLDPLHIYFLQSDVKEFDQERPTLEDKLLRQGDNSAANRIFARFLERFDQQVGQVNDLLKNEQFTFTGADTYTLDRKNLPRPADLDEARQLWRERLRYEYLQEKLNKQKPEEIVKTLTRRYARLSRSLHEYDTDDILQLYMNALAHAYDPHSDYFGQASLENFDISMRLSLVGIGAQLEEEDGYCKIVELIPGGPAAKSNKLKPGDRIVAVAQGAKEPVDVVDMKLDKIVDLIRGPKGTEVRLTVIPTGAADPSTHKTVTLLRDEIKLEEQEAKARLIEMPSNQGKSLRLGIIDLPSFYAAIDSNTPGGKSTTADVARLVKKLKAEKVDGIILDLRRNGGGSLDEVIHLTGLFINKGPVVQVRDTEGKIQVYNTSNPPVLYNGPMMVLTSRMSASASEILAGALQDYNRALIVGDTSTFGKGTVQTIIQLAPVMQQFNMKTSIDPGALKLTIQKFFRPGGGSTQLKGVVPDIILPSLDDDMDVGEKTLENPLAWDTVPSAPFHKMNDVQPYLAELRKRSAARIASDKDFTYLREEIAEFKKVMDQKAVSLNEDERMKEKQDAVARAEARKKELASRPEPKEKVYQITLKQVDLPGLPPPMTQKESMSATGTDAAPVTEEDPNAPQTDTAKTPAVDITMDEARRILIDLIALSGRMSASR